MPSRDSETVIRKLRAQGKIPAGVGVQLGRRGRHRAVPGGLVVVWHLVDVVSGEEIGVRSKWSMRALAAAGRWRFDVDGEGVVYVAPDEEADSGRA